MRVNTFFDFCDQIFCTFSILYLWYTIFLYILLQFAPVYSSCFLSVQTLMDISICITGSNQIKIIFTLLVIESSYHLIRIPERKLVPHNTRNCAHFATYESPTRLVNKCMPCGDIDPRHLDDIVLCEFFLRTKYKYLIMAVDIVENKYRFKCWWVCKDNNPILISVEMVLARQYVTCYQCIIWMEESTTKRKRRGDDLYNLSIWCRRYMFAQMMNCPCLVEREIVDSEHERTFCKVCNSWYLCVKECQCEWYWSLFSKICSISYLYIS